MTRFQKLWERTREEIPGAQIVLKKDSWFMKVIFGALKSLLWVFTLGKGRTSWDGFTTTVFRTLYVPNDFWLWKSDKRYKLLRHELVHLRQFRRWPMNFLATKRCWWINALIMGFCYIFVLPVFWTLRAKFERAGYTQTMLTHYELRGFSETYLWKYPQKMGRIFGTGTYMFMWRKNRAKKWAAETLTKIANGEIVNDHDNVDKW